MKVVFVSSITPSGHYSQYVLDGLCQQKNTKVILYAAQHEKDNKPLVHPKVNVKYVWSKGPRYLLQIVNQVLRDNPDIVHVQQEFTMYGGILTSMLFPLLILLLRLSSNRVVVTIHAAVKKSEVTREFLHWFHKDTGLMTPATLKLYFTYTYFFCALFAHKLIVHTKRKYDILHADYFVPENKMVHIPVIIPTKPTTTPTENRKPASRKGGLKTENYILYFGYMVRRKGLQYVLDGFARFAKKHPGNNLKLVMAGGVIAGQEKAFEEIKDFIAKHKLQQKVLLKGFIEESQQDELYAGARAVVLPAVISMGSSGPLFHAMSYGKCVFASDIGYLREDIANGKTGILTDNNHWEDIFVQAQNTKQVHNIEQGVKQKAQNQSPLAMGKLYVKLYASIV